MRPSCVIARGLPAFLAAGLVAGHAVSASAQPGASAIALQPFVADGFQANGISPVVLEGRPIGKNATWRRVAGPILSSPFAMIPRVAAPTIPEDAAPFPGAGCQAEYSRDEIITEGDEGTLTIMVYGVRCEPYIQPPEVAGSSVPAASHVTIGTYSILGGSGQFRDVVGGTGAMALDARADGRVFLSIRGHIAYPTGPVK